MIVKEKNNNKIPHGNKVIWRYLSLDKFLDLIVSEELFFANAAKMTDKYEGLIPKRNQNYLIDELCNNGLSIEEAKHECKRKLEVIHHYREKTLLNCWTINQNESYALWKIYLGGAKAGVSIKSTVAKLTRAFNSGKEPFDEIIYMGEVSYSDYIKDEPENRFKIITTKNRFYEYEKELRLFIFCDDTLKSNSELPYDGGIGRRYKVDIDELISEIYLSPFSRRWFDNTMAKIIEQIKPTLRDRIKNSEILDE